jgi:hypothetical protein
MKKASKDLEVFLDKAHAVCVKQGMKPKVFEPMRQRYGTLEAIRKIVTKGVLQDFLVEMQKLGIARYSLEAAVLKFPNEFDAETIACARWRLKLVREKA